MPIGTIYAINKIEMRLKAQVEQNENIKKMSIDRTKRKKNLNVSQQTSLEFEHLLESWVWQKHF